nr:PREDICTED: uncharacterized protein LOC103313022 isoform X2 [Tribolium castaneum]|eukprot:XP_015839800.1 PREDICTED: uncharacterized protein LOC103313022 isoform X2 [Tribolium castaneum]
MQFLYVFSIYVFILPPIKCTVRNNPSLLIYEFVEITKNLTNLFRIINDSNYITHDDKEEHVFTTLDVINNKIRGLNRSLYGDELTANVIARDLPIVDIKTIDTHFSEMENFVRHYKQFPKSIFLDNAYRIISPNANSSVMYLKRRIYKQITSIDFLEPFLKRLKIFYNFVNIVLLTHGKAFVLHQTAYNIINLYEKFDVANKIHQSRAEFIRDINNIIRMLIKNNVENISRELWRCNPDKHIRGKTYLEITNFLHGYIINKKNLDPKKQCVNECDSFKMTAIQNCDDDIDEPWCFKESPCSRIISCTYIDSSMDVCLANVPRDNRRYHHIELGNGTFFGTNQQCTRPKINLATYSESLIFKCSYCFCLCDEGQGSYSDRYINLRISMSNISDNRVVTGLRFIKHNRIVHLQVQEGKLLEKGNINPTTVQWVPPEDYKITDRDIYKGQDYHTISWEERTIELTKVIAKAGSVVTGVRFKRTFGSLNLQVLTTAFDFNTGKLEKNSDSDWGIFESAPYFNIRHKFRLKVNLNPSDVPVRTNLDFTDFSENMYIEFANTDYRKDAGQTTIPFFDAQAVNSTTPTPLSGIGLFHKGRKGYGGFIAPKIITYDFSRHILNQIDP